MVARYFPVNTDALDPLILQLESTTFSVGKGSGFESQLDRYIFCLSLGFLLLGCAVLTGK